MTYIHVYIYMHVYNLIYIFSPLRHVFIYTPEKYFRNLIKLTRNQIVFTIFRLIWNTNERVCLFSKSIGAW